jgi:hypothetical protein
MKTALILPNTILLILFLLSMTIFLDSSVYAGSGMKEAKGFDSEKAIAVEATIIAQKKLAQNIKDKVGMTLMNLANHIYPYYKPLLLLRAKMKYNLPISTPDNKGTGEAEFVNFLKKRTAELKHKSNQRDQHLCLIFNSVIRIFDPDDEKALVALIKFSDAGAEMDIDKLLSKKFSTMPYFELDPKDPRYAIDNVKKTVKVPADTPWTDTWVKIKKGKVIRINAKRFWTLGSDGTFPYVDGDGFDNVSMKNMVDRGNVGKKDRGYKSKFRAPKFVTKKLKGKKDMRPGCLLAKIGKQIEPVGKKSIFRAESEGILYLGPFEWDSYHDNSGYLSVDIEVSDK